MIFGGGSPGLMRMMHQDEGPGNVDISRSLLRRVAAYGWPYRNRILIMLLSILVGSALGLAPPLILRQLIDHALPGRDYGQLNLLAAAMVAVPFISGLVSVLQRYLSVGIGEGIIFDLRRALYTHMQRMSLRFFTATKTGE